MRSILQALPSRLLLLHSLFLILTIPPTTNLKSVIDPCNSENSCPSLLAYRLPWASKFSEIASLFRVVSVPGILASNNLDPKNPPAQNYQIVPAKTVVKLSISCPCVDGIRTLSIFYTVRAADTVALISEGYGGLVSPAQIRSANGVNGTNPLVSGQEIVIRTCSSRGLNWRNESLIVPNGSYALTANDCIKCNCTPTDLSLQCWPSGIAGSCSHLQCKDSNLFIGQEYQNPTKLGCNVTQCVYRGHSSSKIFSSLRNYSHIQCSGNKSEATELPLTSPSNGRITIPLITFPPSPSPSSSPSDLPPKVVVPSDPTKSSQTSNNSKDCRLLTQSSGLMLILVFALPFLL